MYGETNFEKPSPTWNGIHRLPGIWGHIGILTNLIPCPVSEMSAPTVIPAAAENGPKI